MFSVSTRKYVIYHGGLMENKRYVLFADGNFMRAYDTFKEALWDSEFYQLMHKEVSIYQEVVKNGEEIKHKK